MALHAQEWFVVFKLPIKNGLYKIEGSENQLSFRINSITPASASVPEPSMAAVVSIGFLSLAVMSWRRKRES